jgi:4-alpha-glucanotransferase
MSQDLSATQQFLFSTPAEKQWHKIGVHTHTGLNIPLFALHSQKSGGIGEFPDFLPIIDWCKEIGIDVIQTLPLNDTGIDTSPYSALTSTALNPMHLGLSSLPDLDKFPHFQASLDLIKLHNKTQRVNYTVLYQERDAFLKEYFNHVYNNFKNQECYQDFIKNNPWLNEYALFKTLKIIHLWSPWEEWPSERQNPTAETFNALLKEFESAIAYHVFIQYLCFQQMEEVKKYANEKGIFIKGDIPILINRESADVWRHRSLFNTDFAAGAPPDMYKEDGQKWGFPIYNWEEIENQHYHWWKVRLEVATRLYDIYRVDHVVGFFRIWAIPLDKTAIEGQFIPKDESQWIPQGEKIMRMMLSSADMLPIGEDLGVVPPPVRITLRNLGICGTKVVRWERAWNEDKHFIDPKTFNPIGMTTVSTHDSETLMQWWHDNAEQAKDYAKSKGWDYNPNLSKEYLFKILYESHHSGTLFHINLLNEYFPLVDGLAWDDLDDERINFPGLILERNWTYRYRPSVEEIVSNQPLREVFKKLISQ